MFEVEIHWQSPVGDARLEFHTEHPVLEEEDLLEILFCQTNTYSDALWDEIEGVLPVTRPHTAISVGDTVRIGKRTYLCENVGWTELGGDTPDFPA